jgi:hypothetical protein
MRRTLVLIGTAAATLSLAGLALADGFRSSAAAPVAATFTTNKVRSETRVCTDAAGKTYQVSKGRYEGTAVSGNADIAGPIQISVKSVYNQTDKIGVVDGWVKFRDASGERRATAMLTGILGDGGAVNGFVAGRVLGNVTGNLLVDATFNGSLGNGDAIASKAVVLSRLDCRKAETPKPAVKLQVKGEVDALSATQISVKPRDGSPSQVCAIKAGVSPSTSGLVVKTTTVAGTKVEMKCGPVDNVMTLLKLETDD